MMDTIIEYNEYQQDTDIRRVTKKFTFGKVDVLLVYIEDAELNDTIWQVRLDFFNSHKRKSVKVASLMNGVNFMGFTVRAMTTISTLLPPVKVGSELKVMIDDKVYTIMEPRCQAA